MRANALKSVKPLRRPRRRVIAPHSKRRRHKTGRAVVPDRENLSDRWDQTGNINAPYQGLTLSTQVDGVERGRLNSRGSLRAVASLISGNISSLFVKISQKIAKLTVEPSERRPLSCRVLFLPGLKRLRKRVNPHSLTLSPLPRAAK